MRLVDLQPEFMRIEMRPCAPGDGCAMVSPHTEHEYHVPCDTLAAADGIRFLCPKCFRDKGGARGTHRIYCWRPRVPQAENRVGPGRWELVGTSFEDLSFVGRPSSSIKLEGGCGAHFYVERGGLRVDP